MSDDRKQKPPIEVTRDELYRQVWQTPMIRLAEQYGITGNGLAKVCRRLNVPYPPRGHWAKKAAGKKVVIDELPPPGARTPLSVTINPTPAPSRPQLPAAAKVQFDAARAESASIAVPERLHRPHPIVARWIEERERRKRESRLERDPWSRRLIAPKELCAVDRRRYRILDTLFKVLEKQGGKAKEDERGELCVEMQGEPIQFRLREKQTQVRRPLNEDEKRWASRNDKGWRQELQPTGRLVLTIGTYLPGNMRKEWIETDSTTMESLLPEIVATFVAAGPLLVEQRRQREEDERQQRIAEQKRYEQQQRRKLDNNRWRRFVEFAQQRREAQLAQSFLDELQAQRIDLQQEVAGYTLAAWIAWVEGRIANADPLNYGAGSIFESIAEVTTWGYD